MRFHCSFISIGKVVSIEAVHILLTPKRSRFDKRIDR
jgi:hypothetical protein